MKKKLQAGRTIRITIQRSKIDASLANPQSRTMDLEHTCRT